MRPRQTAWLTAGGPQWRLDLSRPGAAGGGGPHGQCLLHPAPPPFHGESLAERSSAAEERPGRRVSQGLSRASGAGGWALEPGQPLKVRTAIVRSPHPRLGQFRIAFDCSQAGDRSDQSRIIHVISNAIADRSQPRGDCVDVVIAVGQPQQIRIHCAAVEAPCWELRCMAPARPGPVGGSPRRRRLPAADCAVGVAPARSRAAEAGGATARLGSLRLWRRIRRGLDQPGGRSWPTPLGEAWLHRHVSLSSVALDQDSCPMARLAITATDAPQQQAEQALSCIHVNDLTSHLSRFIMEV